jgi:Chaperone of endosialidase
MRQVGTMRMSVLCSVGLALTLSVAHYAYAWTCNQASPPCFVAANGPATGGIGISGGSNDGIGVAGTDDSYGVGVEGMATTTSGDNAVGVVGAINATQYFGGAQYPAGVYGIADTGYGVYGQGGGSYSGGYFTSSSTGDGVSGIATGTGDEAWGVYGSSDSTDGVHGVSNTSGFSGVAGIAGVSGANGAYGSGSGGGYGVWGVASGTYGVYGQSSEAGSSSVAGIANGNNVHGLYGSGSGTGNGVNAVASGAAAVWASSSGASGDGVYAQTSDSSQYGVHGYNSSSGVGVYGTSSSGHGVEGASTAASTYGVYGTASSSTGTAVVGVNSATTGNSTGLYGQTGNTTSYAGYGGWFVGNVEIAHNWSVYYNSTGSNPTAVCIGGACTPSDRRFKKNIEPLANAIDRLLQINGVTYEWKELGKDHPAGRQTGVIAQDVEKVFPDWVSETSEGVKVLNIDQRTLLGVEVEAFRTLKAENDELKARMDRMENGGHPIVGGFLPRFEGVGWFLAGIMGTLMCVMARKLQNAKKA